MQSGPVDAFKKQGVDFIVKRRLPELVARMNARRRRAADRCGRSWQREIEARDREIDNTYTKDAQVTAIRGARNYLGDKLIRVATPHRLLDPRPGR